MFFFGYGHGAVLLLAVTQTLAFTYLENGEIARVEQSTEVGVNSLQVQPDNLQPRNEQSTCQADYDAMVAASNSYQEWALTMRDATSKLQSGIMSGNWRDLGMYDQCIGVKPESNSARIQGQHCLYSVSDFSLSSRSAKSRILNPFDGSLSGRASAAGFNIASYSSVCLPSSCNESEVLDIVNVGLKNVSETFNTRIDLVAEEAICARLEPEPFTVGEIVTILFFAIIGAFVLSCTVCDFLRHTKFEKSFPVINTFAQFSMYKNALGLFNNNSGKESMPAIHGIRYLSMCWVVLGHRYVFSTMQPIVNFLEIGEWSESFHALYILMAPFAVDTFFVISGFLLSYSFLNTVQAGKPYNFPLSIVHRYIRLTPPLAVLILFAAVLLHRVGSGAAWEPISNILVVFCRENWWTNLLYVQNYVNPREMCFIHTWYLAVDMHLFLISPIILYPLWKRPKFGIGILAFFITAATITTFTLFAVYGYKNALIRTAGNPARMYDDFIEAYIPTHHRGCAYFIGIILGYDLANNKRSPTRRNVALNWFVAFLLLGYCTWATRYIYRADYEYNDLFESFYAALTRPCWSIAIAWIVYACTQGYGGFVAKFLSLPFFVPLSRLSYTTYLSHVMIQILKSASARTPTYFSDFGYFDTFWGDLVMAIVLALILTLFIESPFRVLEKLLKRKMRKPREPRGRATSA